MDSLDSVSEKPSALRSRQRGEMAVVALAVAAFAVPVLVTLPGATSATLTMLAALVLWFAVREWRATSLPDGSAFRNLPFAVLVFMVPMGGVSFFVTALVIQPDCPWIAPYTEGTPDLCRPTWAQDKAVDVWVAGIAVTVGVIIVCGLLRRRSRVATVAAPSVAVAGCVASVDMANLAAHLLG